MKLTMNKIISFSLFGDSPKYTIGAIKNADLALTIYPDWDCWFHVGNDVPKKIINELKARENCKVLLMDGPSDWTGMFWRFSPCSDPLVDIVISRDTDSRLNHREKDAVNAWIESDKLFHIMRDHPYHATQILGGMWGAKHPILKNMKSLIDSYKKGNFWQVDQNFLKDIIYPKIKNYSMVHDEFFEKTPFPSKHKRNDSFYVGQAFNEKDEIL